MPRKLQLLSTVDQARMGGGATVEIALRPGESTAIADWRILVCRVAWASACLVFLVAACGGGEMSLTEYVERLNVIVGQARQQYEDLVTSPEGRVLVAEPEELSEFDPQDLQTALDSVREIEAGVDDATAAIEPPEQVADLHDLFFDFDSVFISSQEALAARAASATDWNELSETPEMAAYRAALAADKQDCVDSQAEVNAIGEQRGAFAETPWIPAELKEIFEVALGCDGYPENPEDTYRPPASSNP